MLLLQRCKKVKTHVHSAKRADWRGPAMGQEQPCESCRPTGTEVWVPHPSAAAEDAPVSQHHSPGCSCIPVPQPRMLLYPSSTAEDAPASQHRS